MLQEHEGDQNSRYAERCTPPKKVERHRMHGKSDYRDGKYPPRAWYAHLVHD